MIPATLIALLEMLAWVGVLVVLFGIAIAVCRAVGL